MAKDWDKIYKSMVESAESGLTLKEAAIKAGDLGSRFYQYICKEKINYLNKIVATQNAIGHHPSLMPAAFENFESNDEYEFD